jgi:hypothetical protein
MSLQRPRRLIVLSAAFCLGLAACGQADDVFVGSFQGTVSTDGTDRVSGARVNAGPDPITITIARDLDGNLFLQSACNVGLNARNAETFELVPQSCSLVASDGRPITATFVRGTGVLDEPRLTLEWVSTTTALDGSYVIDSTSRFEGIRVE